MEKLTAHALKRKLYKRKLIENGRCRDCTGPNDRKDRGSRCSRCVHVKRLKERVKRGWKPWVPGGPGRKPDEILYPQNQISEIPVRSA